MLAHFERNGFDGAPRFLGVDARGREILTFIDGFAPPHNGFRLPEQGVRAGARLLRCVHDLTEGTTFAQGGEVACHPNLSQPNFIFRDLRPVAIIDWDGTRPGTRLENVAAFLWAFVHPAVYGEGEPAVSMLAAAADEYGWSESGLTDAMLERVRDFQTVVEGDAGASEWAAAELAYWSDTRSCSAPCWASPRDAEGRACTRPSRVRSVRRRGGGGTIRATRRRSPRCSCGP